MSAKVSIITATYNDVDNFRKIASQIQGQSYDNIEYIVIDGGSQDGTLEAVRELKEKLGDRMKYLSESDNGIYEAINKGISLAAGDIIGCCFDEFTSKDVISKMVAAIEAEDVEGVHADLCYMDGGKVVRRWRMGQGNLRLGWLPGHPTLYLKREVYETYGLYKEDYKVSADYEFMVRILKDGKVRLAYIPEDLVHMAYGGTSNNGLKAYITSLAEGHRGLKENHIPFPWLVDICRTIRVLMQFRA